jgi:ferredoxin
VYKLAVSRDAAFFIGLLDRFFPYNGKIPRILPIGPNCMANLYTVEILHRGNTQTIQVPDDRTILEVAVEQGFDLPSSCTAGVCTTCAAQVTAGEVFQEDGVGLSPDLQEKGFTLLCVSYPRSDCKVETDKEDAVYELQFGQYQK